MDDKDLVWDRLKHGINHWTRYDTDEEWMEAMRRYSRSDTYETFKLEYLAEWETYNEQSEISEVQRRTDKRSERQDTYRRHLDRHERIYSRQWKEQGYSDDEYDCF